MLLLRTAWGFLRGFLRGLWIASLLFLFVPPVAQAAVPGNAVFPSAQLWVLAIGSVVPLLTYVLNHWAPWLSEPIKAGVLVVVSAGVAALYTAVATNVIGFNTPTLQLLLTGVVAALGAHHLLWKPSGVSLLLGGGSNRPPATPAPVAAVGGTATGSSAAPPPPGAAA